MAESLTISTIYKGEPVSIDFYAKDPSGDVIASPASQTVHMTVSETDGGSVLQGWSSSGSQINLADAGTGKFEIRLSRTDLALLTEGQTYYYNIWTELSGVRRVQVVGTIKLLKSIEPES